MNRPEPIDVTAAMEAEADLMEALGEWANAGAPVVEVINAVNRLIEARIEIALRPFQSTGDRNA